MKRFAISLAAIVLAAPFVDAQEYERREFSTIRADQAPSIDGDLNDDVWKSAQPIEGFTQREPDEGKPSSEETTVWIAYDESAIYVAARMKDSHPVTSRLGRRDRNQASDWFRLFLDPHFDRRTGVGFWVNPSNVQIDMVLYNDGWDDWDWDAVWESATSITEDGWNVEMRIPYSQLRFPFKKEHTWGLLAERKIHRTNEISRIQHWPRTETGFTSRFANLKGIRDIKPARSFEVVPYVVGRTDLLGTVSADDPFTDSTEYDGSAGVDIKYGLSSNLTLTGTLNPDFGQVEVDPAQINLSQFELFFPEKRPFFIEGSQLFNFGQGGSNNNFNFNIFTPDLFYTRRIGRSPQATYAYEADYRAAPGESTILGAAKLTGKFGDGWSIGVLDALTEEEEGDFQLLGDRFTRVVEPMTNYFVSRVAKESDGGMSRIGGIVTAVNRDLSDDLEWMKKAAYTGGIDGYKFFGDKDVIWEWYVSGSRVEGSPDAIESVQNSSARYYNRPDAGHVDLDSSRTSLSGWAASSMVAKQTGKWKYNLKLHSYSPGFDTNDLGFMTRTDITASSAALIYNDPDPKGLLRYRNAWIATYQNFNHDGDHIASGVSWNAYGQFNNYWSAWTWGGVSPAVDDDRATRGGPVVTDPSGYHVGVGFGSDDRKPLAFEIWGEKFYGSEGTDGYSVGSYLAWRPMANLNLTLTPSYDDSHRWLQYVTAVDDPTAVDTYGKRYVFAEIDRKGFELGTRVDWTFSPSLSLQMYLQPFVASGDYVDFKELDQPRTVNYNVYGVDSGTIAFDSTNSVYNIDPDGAGPASGFSFGNPDFNFRSLRGSAILRWEYRPGSAVYLVWNENRASSINDGRFRLGDDIDGVIDAPSDDVFLIKFSYWLNL